jgi:hypothetical protein
MPRMAKTTKTKVVSGAMVPAMFVSRRAIFGFCSPESRDEAIAQQPLGTVRAVEVPLESLPKYQRVCTCCFKPLG